MDNPNENQAKPLLRNKAIYVLPNLFTTAALFFGFFSLIFSMQNRLDLAAFCIFFSAFMDGLDGKVARLTGTTSDFGIQYDSLSDLISFGAAPAILVWQAQLQYHGRIGIGIAFLVLACAALRLARFNVAANTHSQKKFFIGLPSPAAGCALSSFILFFNATSFYSEEKVKLALLAFTLLVALLMVSRVRYFSFKEFDWAKKHPFQILVLGVFFLVLVFSVPKIFIFPLFCIYILSGLLYTYIYIPYKTIIHNKKPRVHKENQ